MPRARKIRPRREDLKPGECLCDHCVGKCCRYFSLPIVTPATWRDYDEIRAYLAQGLSLVYVEKSVWYLVVMTRCKYLARDNRCAIYFTRPRICREYTTDDCEYDSEWAFEQVFYVPEQAEEYAEATIGPRRRGRAAPPVEAGAGFTLAIETPTTRDDYDAVRWYLAHGGTSAYVKRGRWYLVVEPNPGYDREADDPGKTDAAFETPEQLWEYAEAVLPPRRRKKAPAGNGLVILQ